MAQWLRVRQPSPAGNQALGVVGYSYATPSNAGVSRRDFVNAAVTEVFTRSASVPILAWKDMPTTGYLAGKLFQPIPCRSLDGYPLSLTGPSNRSLQADGSGWFGAVDLPPGEYLLAVEVVSPTITLQVPVAVNAGAVTWQEIRLPACTSETVYLPVVLRQSGP
jgi:hypothetical protein